MKRKLLLTTIMVLAMGITACSADSKEDVISGERIAEKETGYEEAVEIKTGETRENDAESPESEIAEDDEKDSASVEENIACDPMTGIVERYEDNIITIKDPDDDMIYHFYTENAQILEGFSTENARIAEGESLIAVGDKVEISYLGLLGDEEHPGKAAKIVVVTVE